MAGAAILVAGPGGLILKLLRLVHSGRAVGEGPTRVGFSPSADFPQCWFEAGSSRWLSCKGCLTTRASSLLQTGYYPSPNAASEEGLVTEGALIFTKQAVSSRVRRLQAETSSEA